MLRSLVLAAAFAALFCPIAKAQAPTQASSAQTLADKDVPKLVTSRLRCSKPSGPVSVRAFAGGFVFSQPCPSGTDNPDRLVYANDKNGTGARLLQFHRPEGRRMSALATVVFKPAENEIEGSTRRLTRRICRAEGRWRMEGKQPAPGLICWRQTRDCDGNGGWQTTVNRSR